MSIKVKRARLADLHGIAKLFDEYRVFYQQPSDLALAQDFIGERLERGDGLIFCAINEIGEYMGFTQLYPSFSSVGVRRTLILNDLYVTAKTRRSGVAKALLDAAKYYAIAQGIKGLSLSTGIENSAAQVLYESLGYVKDSEYFHYSLSF